MSVDQSGMTSGLLSSIPVYNPNATTTTTKKQDANALSMDCLKMLTAQLQYQEPMEPMQNSEFTGQLAAMSSLSQQEQSNKLLQQLLSAQTVGQVNQAVGYIGRGVVVAGNNMTVNNGSGKLQFNLSNSTAVKIRIMDQSGQMVKEIDPSNYAAGDNTLQITDLPNGKYLFSVIPNSMTDTTTVTPLEYGVVTSVSKDSNNNVTLSLNNHDVLLENVRRVEQVSS